jgi:hypothetical protein
MNEDEPLEKEVAVDPEMLGKIFENLLDVKDRKSKGAFYTPREIVHYMCQESLTNYIVNRVGTPYEDTKNFILYGEIIKDEDFSHQSKVLKKRQLPQSIYDNLKKIDDALADVRVADPAVGSGAFPMGMVNEIVRARNVITAYFAEEVNDYYKSQFWNVTRHPYKLKKDTLKNCIFAVDLEPSAVDIAKLRLWLSLVVEQDIDDSNDEFKKPLTLPNLDCNIICGNSLIDEFEGVKLFNDSMLTGAGNSNDWKADLFQAQVDEVLGQLISKQRDLFYADNHNLKIQLKKEIEDLEKQVIFASCNMTEEIKGRFLAAYKSNSKPFILWKLSFAKVFKDKGGFDIVIGNPPYGAKFEKNEKEILIKHFTTVPDYESADFFIDHSLVILNENGAVNFIVPNMFLANQFAKKYRKHILTDFGIIHLYNLSNCSVFDSAVVRNVILLFSKNKDICNKFSDLNIVDGKIVLTKSIDISKGKLNDNIDNWLNLLLQDDSKSSIIDKIRTDTKELITLCNISQGLIPYDKYRGHSEETIKNKIWNANYQKDETYKKELQGKDVGRYSLNWNGQDWLSYGTWLAAPRRPEFFTTGRILVREITNPRIFATYTDEEYYNTPSIINCIEFKVSPYYILGLLNSKLFTFYHLATSPKANKGLFPKILVSDIKKLPIKYDSGYEEKIIVNVKSILQAYSNELDNEIDNLVYQLYGLTPEEIALVEKSVM